MSGASANTTTYSRVSIKAIRLDKFSDVNTNGASWDPLGGRPDIFLKLEENDFKTRKETFTNVFSDTPLTWRLSQPYVMNNFMSALTISFYDEDELGQDDYMGTVVFVPAQYKAGATQYPTSVTLNSIYQPSVRVTLELQWQ
jgi:Ca2+-dependent lipid-binding protein